IKISARSDKVGRTQGQTQGLNCRSALDLAVRAQGRTWYSIRHFIYVVLQCMGAVTTCQVPNPASKQDMTTMCILHDRNY
ncbi:hypothetical protein HaLaN_27228, partial [Haematococcus lacustris]